MIGSLSTSAAILAAKQASGQALADILSSLDIPGCTETQLADRWLYRLQQTGEFYPGGWYDPPPEGIIALCASPDDAYARSSPSSFRPSEFWPSDHHRWEAESVTALYASPVTKASNLIGDFGLSLYLGKNLQIIHHFTRVLALTLEIARYAQVGIQLRDLYQFAMQRIAAEGFQNNIESPTDLTNTNIGHTIPLSYADDPTHQKIAQARSFAEIKETLRLGRKFVNRDEPQSILPDFAFTVEPRLSTASMPNAWFHLTVVFENGKKTIGHGFRPVFHNLNQALLLKLLP